LKSGATGVYGRERMSGPRPNRALGALLAAVLSLCLPATARADGYESAVSRGAAARDRALETGRTQDWQEALDLFAAAAELNPSKEAKFELAEAASHLDLDDEACSAFIEALELGLAGRAEARARAFVESHARELGMLEIRGPAGARVYVNERKRAVLPVSRPLFVRPGTARIQVDQPGLGAWERDVTIEPGATLTLSVTSEPHADADHTAAVTPVRRDGPRRASRPPRTPEPAPLPPLLIAGGVAVAVGAAGAILTSLLLPGERQKLRANCVVPRGDECEAATRARIEAAEDAGDTILTLKTLRWASLGTSVAGAGALGVGVFQLSSAARARPRRSDARVSVSARQFSVAWHAEF
jgi:hypothetical protein